MWSGRLYDIYRIYMYVMHFVTLSLELFSELETLYLPGAGRHDSNNLEWV